MADTTNDQMAKTTASYTQFRVKCLSCGLHFIICTDYPETQGSARRTWYCPECGQHRGNFMAWEAKVEGFIFQTVPGDAPVYSLYGNLV
jgi:rubredoxin